MEEIAMENIVDGRSLNGVRNQKREALLASFYSGVELTEVEKTYFPCSYSDLLLTRDFIPAGTVVSLAGGLSAHYDLLLTLSNGKKIRVELKCSENGKKPREELEWQPWKEGVQFAQGQTKSSKGMKFLPGYGQDLYDAFFADEVKNFLLEYYPALVEMTSENYFACASSMTIPKKEASSLGAKLIASLRDNKPNQLVLQKKWLLFESKWLASKPVNIVEIETLLREAIEEKDMWLVINKKGAHWFHGFTLTSMRADGVHPKSRGGSLLRFSIQLKQKTTDIVKDVSIEVKLHWKNGGQAVQNLNYLIC